MPEGSWGDEISAGVTDKGLRTTHPTRQCRAPQIGRLGQCLHGEPGPAALLGTFVPQWGLRAPASPRERHKEPSGVCLASHPAPGSAQPAPLGGPLSAAHTLGMGRRRGGSKGKLPASSQISSVATPLYGPTGDGLRWADAPAQCHHSPCVVQAETGPRATRPWCSDHETLPGRSGPAGHVLPSQIIHSAAVSLTPGE